jgi:hypothetical protein
MRLKIRCSQVNTIIPSAEWVPGWVICPARIFRARDDGPAIWLVMLRVMDALMLKWHDFPFVINYLAAMKKWHTPIMPPLTIS